MQYLLVGPAVVALYLKHFAQNTCRLAALWEQNIFVSLHELAKASAIIKYERFDRLAANDNISLSQSLGM